MVVRVKPFKPLAEWAVRVYDFQQKCQDRIEAISKFGRPIARGYLREALKDQYLKEKKEKLEMHPTDLFDYVCRLIIKFERIPSDKALEREIDFLQNSILAHWCDLLYTSVSDYDSEPQPVDDHYWTLDYKEHLKGPKDYCYIHSLDVRVTQMPTTVYKQYTKYLVDEWFLKNPETNKMPLKEIYLFRKEDGKYWVQSCER